MDFTYFQIATELKVYFAVWFSALMLHLDQIEEFLNNRNAARQPADR
jgi:hypothetical protein